MKNSSKNQPAEGQYRYKKIKEYVYDMHSTLGKGNFSTVYRGRNQQNSQQVAVKVVKMSSLTFQKLEELLEQEIAISRALDHPNTIRCYQVLKSVNHCYFITELCEEGTLQKVAKKRGPMSEQDVWPYIRDVYQGLKYLNSKQIVHRDIKLANIFISKGIAKLADFGFAVYSNESFKDLNIGSPLYMSPQGYIDNIYGPKTDVWAFGLILYQLLHGKAPLAHITSQQQLRKHLKTPIKQDQMRNDLSCEIKEVIMRCLEVEENRRIRMEDIEMLPYFVQNGGSKGMSEVNKSNALRFRRLSVPTTMQCIRTPTRNNNQNPFKPQKQNYTPLLKPSSNNFFNPNTQSKHYLLPSTKFLTQTQLPTPKHRPSSTLLPSSTQIQQNTSIMLDYRQQDLITCNITFNQAIGLIHYCRIGFKLLQEQQNKGKGKNQELTMGVKNIVMRVLEEVKARVNNGMIVYTDEENKGKKESKLKLVVGQYIAKYGKEIAGERGQVLLPRLIDTLNHTLTSSENTKQLQYSYLCMLFTQFTSLLVSCTKNKSYKVFGENGLIDCCLEEKNIPHTAEEYGQAKKRYEDVCRRNEEKRVPFGVHQRNATVCA